MINYHLDTIKHKHI